MNTGWLCPKCGSAHAPTVLTCPAMAGTYEPIPHPYPEWPKAPDTWPSPSYPYWTSYWAAFGHQQ